MIHPFRYHKSIALELIAPQYTNRTFDVSYYGGSPPGVASFNIYREILGQRLHGLFLTSVSTLKTVLEETSALSTYGTASSPASASLIGCLHKEL
jgi:hypothetical protein